MCLTISSLALVGVLLLYIYSGGPAILPAVFIGYVTIAASWLPVRVRIQDGWLEVRNNFTRFRVPLAQIERAEFRQRSFLRFWDWTFPVWYWSFRHRSYYVVLKNGRRRRISVFMQLRVDGEWKQVGDRLPHELGVTAPAATCEDRHGG